MDRKKLMEMFNRKARIGVLATSDKNGNEVYPYIQSELNLL